MPVKKRKDKDKGKFKKRRPNKKFPFRKKVCEFCRSKSKAIDYKDVMKLQKYVSERGKILPNRISGNCPWHQREVARAIKRARAIALMPYVAGHR